MAANGACWHARPCARLTATLHPAAGTHYARLDRILQAGKLVPRWNKALHARYSVHRLADEPDQPPTWRARAQV